MFSYSGRWHRAGLLAYFCTLFAAALSAATQHFIQPDGFGRQTWESDNGLPQNTVHAVLQTRDGYLWVGTEEGLARFDGTRFVVFNSHNTPALQSNNIRALLESRDGSLWIATAEGITRYQDGQFATVKTESVLPSKNVWSLYEDGEGTVWVVTAAGIVRLSEKTLGPVNRGALPWAVAGSLDEVRAASAGVRWVGNQTGLRAWNHGELKTYTKNNGLPANKITALYQATDGTMWVGTEAGFARIVDGLIVPLSPGNSFRGETILAITEDHEGNLWVGTESSGLSILRREKFITFSNRDGLPDNLVRCVFTDRNGVVWIGTDAGGLVRYQNGNFSALTTRNGLTSNAILALAESRDGNLLIGTPDGLNIIRNGAISAITSAEGLPDDFVRSIAPASDGSIWIGTRRGLARIQNGHIAVYTESNGLGSDLVGAMVPDEKGGLWIATLGGLTNFANGKLTNYTTHNGLSSNVITALYRDHGGNLWIGTQGGGLNVFWDGKFFRFPSAASLPDVIYGLAEDSRQHLWISSNTGMFCVSGAELLRFAHRQSDTLNIASYGTSDGLEIAESSGGGHPAISEGKDGTLWFATLKGVAVLRRATPRRVPPPVVIESVSVDDATFDPSKLATIPPGRSRVSFTYAGLSFSAPQKIQFRYKLEPFDRKWVDAGTRRVAYYTNLSPGNYRFHVVARNNDGVWNENGASFAFRVQPHFYQTYWFYTLVAVAVALLAWIIYRWRLKQVETRFGAVLQERNRIAREIHDTLAQGFAGVSVQLELVSRLLQSSSEVAREHLDQARVLVRNSLAEARRSIWELRSQSATEDLAARISKMANQLASSGSAKVKMQVRGTYRPVGPKAEQELLMIAQEALTNAIRHADAEHIDIELAFDAKKMRMTIADDGKGFECGAVDSGPNGHFGLRGMRERAAQINAALIVKSCAGQGTTILVETIVN